MSTDAQINANRANALLSTGPKTEEGKKASSANATKTGLTSGKIYFRDGEAEEFDNFSQNLTDELKPEGELQGQLFDVILHASWNIRRCMDLEGTVQIEAKRMGIADAMLSEPHAKQLDRLYRYKRMHESARRQAIAELRQLQTEQLWRSENERAQNEPILANAAKVAKETLRIRTAESKASQPRPASKLEPLAIVRPPMQNEPNPDPVVEDQAA